MLAAEFGTGQILWSMLWFFLFQRAKARALG